MVALVIAGLLFFAVAIVLLVRAIALPSVRMSEQVRQIRQWRKLASQRGHRNAFDAFQALRLDAVQAFDSIKRNCQGLATAYSQQQPMRRDR